MGEARGENIRTFVHDISAVLAVWNATSFLLGEYAYDETQILPEFSAADGILWMSRQISGNAVVRKIEAIKIRGQGTLPGRHTFRITAAGIEVFPRMLPIEDWPKLPLERDRVKFGVQGLDQMMNGGIPRGEVTLIAGSSGTGKTLLSLYFIAEGVQHDEPGVMITFEENPQEHERKARSFGWNLAEWEKKKMLGMIYLRPMDLSVDEVLARVLETVSRLKAKRVVINSISGFEMGISPADAPEFRESLFRLVASLSGKGVTTVMTTEIPNVLGDFVISEQHISFIADNAIVLRFTEIESQLRKVIMIIKMRTSSHDRDLRQYEITGQGIIVQKPLTEYSGVLSGIPTLRTLVEPQPFTAGLSDQEESLMHVLLALDESTPDQLAESMGIDLKQINQVLDKLVDTGYVAKTGTKTQPRYRVALVTPGLMLRRR